MGNQPRAGAICPFPREYKSSRERGRTGRRAFDLREPRQTPAKNDFAATTSPQRRFLGLIPGGRAGAQAPTTPPAPPPELSATPRKGRQRRGSRSPTRVKCAGATLVECTDEAVHPPSPPPPRRARPKSVRISRDARFWWRSDRRRVRFAQRRALPPAAGARPPAAGDARRGVGGLAGGGRLRVRCPGPPPRGARRVADRHVSRKR